jgi:DNA-binding beta-propeller fold protein YncE
MIALMSRAIVRLVALVALLWVTPALAADPGSTATPAPAGIAVDGDGNVWVSDYALDRLVKFAPDGSLLGQWGGSGSALGQFNAPFGVAVDASNSVYVVDQLNSRVQRFANDGTVLSAWGAAGAAAGQLRTPFGVAIGSGHVYVADFGNDRVEVFSADGSLVSVIGAHGSGDGQFERPAGVAVASDGTLFVTDHFNDRIERFSSDGHFEAQLGTTQASSSSLTGGAPLAAGPLLAAASSTPTLVGTPAAAASATPLGTTTAVPTVSPSATPLGGLTLALAPVADTQLRRPEGIVLDRDGNLCVADYGRDRVVKLSPDGRLLQSWGAHGSGPGEFIGPKGVAIDPNTGRLYVADTGNARVQRLAPDGTPEASWSMPPVASAS